MEKSTAYRMGWNACLEGFSRMMNPFIFTQDNEKFKDWKEGYTDGEDAWLDPEEPLPTAYPIEEII